MKKSITLATQNSVPEFIYKRKPVYASGMVANVSKGIATEASLGLNLSKMVTGLSVERFEGVSSNMDFIYSYYLHYDGNLYLTTDKSQDLVIVFRWIELA